MEQLYFDFPNDDILLAHPAGGDQVIPVQVSYDNVEFSINHSGMWAGFPNNKLLLYHPSKDGTCR
jgi:hypothetical protein